MSKVIIEKVKEVILPYLEEENIILYDIEYVFEDNENILRIYIDNEEENMDLLTCVSISEGISKLLDLNDPLDVPYSLEVSSPGAERVLRNKEEVIKAVGKYIYAETSDVSVYGTLLSVNEDILNIEYLAKNIKKKIDIKYDLFNHLITPIIVGIIVLVGVIVLNWALKSIMNYFVSMLISAIVGLVFYMFWIYFSKVFTVKEKKIFNIKDKSLSKKSEK